MTAVVDTPPVFDAPPDDVPPLRCQFDGCENSVVKPARGRTPKYCPDHKATTPAGPAGKKAASWGKAVQVEEALTRYLNGLGFAVTMVNPADGQVIAKGSAAVAHELVELGRVDKEWRKWLEKAAAPGKYGPLFLTVTGVYVIPIMANHGLLPQFRLEPSTAETGRGVPG